MRAAIDIGSNSVLLLVCEFSNKIEKEILNLSHVTSLGKDLDKNGFFLEETMDATFNALKEYKEQLEKLNFRPENAYITATEASRVATNAKQFYQKVKSELGFNVEIISGEEEAYYTAIGVLSGISNKKDQYVIMDIGGASTELINIKSDPFKILSSISIPVGSVRATDWMQNGTFKTKMKDLLNFDFKDYESEELVCVAGSMTSLATMFLGKTIYNDSAIDGLCIEQVKFKIYFESIKNKMADELLAQFPFLGKRAKAIIGGADVATQISEKLKVKKLIISTRGLRYGVLVSGGVKHDRK